MAETGKSAKSVKLGAKKGSKPSLVSPKKKTGGFANKSKSPV
jgi:hypothetical protein